LAMAQESSPQTGSVGGVDLSVGGDAGEHGSAMSSRGGAKAPAKGAASTWGITRNAPGGTRQVSSLAAGHLRGKAQEQAPEPSTAAGAPKKEAHPVGKQAVSRVTAGGGSGGFDGASKDDRPVFTFTGVAHSSGSHGREQRRASTRLIDDQLKGHSVPRHRSSRKSKHVRPRPRDAEPTKREENCDRSSKLQLCVWL
jgi:hypothetical protein